MASKLLCNDGEVITMENFFDRADESCVFRPKVQRFWQANKDGNLLIERGERMSTISVHAGDCLVIDDKFLNIQVMSERAFHGNFDVINNSHTKSEC